MEDYTYYTPPGYGDTFFMYAFDAAPLTNGSDYQQLLVPIADGDFVMRYWAGLDTCATSIQIRNRLQRPLNSGAQGINLTRFSSGVPHIPEEWYPENGKISFDLFGVNKLAIGTDTGVTTYASQMMFAGVRRRKNVQGDPMESQYAYYIKPYTYSYALTINNYSTVGGVLQNGVLNLQNITDGYDFVLEKIRCVQTPNGTFESPTPTFSILLLNGNREQVSNIPIISQRIINFPVTANLGERNYFPTPPIMYRANSAIRFWIYSLLVSPTTLPVNYDLEFIGYRRYPCK